MSGGSGSSRGELGARYAESLPEKLNELALAWEAWLADPELDSAREQVHLRVHKLAGSAPAYGYHDLGREAQRLDSLMQDWTGEVPQLRSPPSELCRRVSLPMEALLRTLGRAAREAATLGGGEAGARAERMLFVLFLEDDREQAAIWRAALTAQGLRVRVADSLPAFEAELVLETPDVLLVDFWLDGTPRATSR